MIVEAIIKLFTNSVTVIIGGLPTPILTVINGIEIPVAIQHGAYFFPLDCLAVAISTFIVWYGILISWSTIEWVYKKLPGVD